MDQRTKRQKLEAMANQTASPEEAKIAREKLEKMEPVLKDGTYPSNDPFSDILMVFVFNGVRHEIRRSDVLKNAQYAPPSGMDFNAYGTVAYNKTVAFTASYPTAYSETTQSRPSFNFRATKIRDI